MIRQPLYPRVRIGQLWIDALTFAQALDAVESLVGRGGSVFTPNVDHVVNVERDEKLRAAYARADLSLPDGQPVVWASRLLGTRLPEKISGSDLVPPLLARAAQKQWRVFLLGGGPGVALLAADRLRVQGVNVVGAEGPAVGVEPLGDEPALIQRVVRARPDLVLVGLGSPKQELFLDRVVRSLAPAVGLGVGATLDFIAGTLPRAPRWMSRAGLEWLFRLAREPRRLSRRYLWNDPRFALVIWKALRTPRATRVEPALAPTPLASRQEG